MDDALGHLSPEEQEELRATFMSQAFELLEVLNDGILRLEAGEEGEGLLQEIQRAIHTLKGDSTSFGLHPLTLLTHRMEDLLSLAREGTVPLHREVIDLLFSGADACQKLLQGKLDPQELGELLMRLETSIAEWGVRNAEWKNPNAEIRMPKSAPWSPVISGLERATLRVEAQRIEKVMNLVGELVIAYSSFHQAFKRVLDRLPLDVRCSMLNGERQSGIEYLIGRMEEANGLMERTLSDLQKSVFEIRMVPIEHAFRRFPRLIRDLAAESGKLITLMIEGGETELDKGIVDHLGEPLVHLLRNAVDHGIEPPEERRRLGKPLEGTITLRARHEGNSILIEVEDDGRGIDPTKVKRKAAEKGLIGLEELKRLEGAEVFNLIFLPGFSTAETVTSTSGRGIGMDVVKAAMERLKGSIRGDSQVGRGTRFTLRLPLTLAVIKAMLFEAEGQLFAIPLSSLVEIARVFPSGISTVDGKEVVRLRDRVISLVRLSHVLNLPAPSPQDVAVRGWGGVGGTDAQPSPPTQDYPPPTNGKAFVLVIGLGEKRIGLLVERLVGEQELVIKTLDAGWIPTGLLAGASILGDGKVVLILDPAACIEKAIRREKARRQGLGVRG